MQQNYSVLSRRTFLKKGAALSGALLLEFNLSASPAVHKTKDQSVNQARAWVKIEENDTVTLIIPKAEMGQGVQTSLAVLIAEEMDADWSKIKTEWAPLAEPYQTLIWPITGASRSIHECWEPLRKIGAITRELLVGAACRYMNQPRTHFKTNQGLVTHLPSGKIFSFGYLAKEAMNGPDPLDVKLKEPSQWNLIGKTVLKLDAADKSQGKTQFGWDYQMPGMLIAQIEQSPFKDARIERIHHSKTKAVSGVLHVITLERQQNRGVAVVADNFWAAQKGRNLLKVDWTRNPNPHDEESMNLFLNKKVNELEGKKQKGDVAEALSAATTKIEAEYNLPYLAHATMETQCATARVQDGRCDVWAPVQNLIRARRWVQRVVGLPEKAIHIHNTFLGGGFGRRLYPDYAAQAAELAMKTGVPVKILWTRKDDILHDFYHPATRSRLKGALDKNGKLTAWVHRVAGMNQSDVALLAGLQELDYDIPNTSFEWSGESKGPLRTGPLRSVGRLHNIFCRECFVDEAAHAAGADPLQFRLNLITGKERLKAVLETLRQKLAWNGASQNIGNWGFAINADAQYFQESKFSYIAVAVQVSVDSQGNIKTPRVVVTLDCGLAVDPQNVESQIQSSIVFALTTALKSKITLQDGVVQQSNFHDYPLLRMKEMPVVETFIMPATDHPTGVGEIATPTTMAALCNGIFQATGNRIRTLPIERTALNSQ